MQLESLIFILKCIVFLVELLSKIDNQIIQPRLRLFYVFIICLRSAFRSDKVSKHKLTYSTPLHTVRVGWFICWLIYVVPR